MGILGGREDATAGQGCWQFGQEVQEQRLGGLQKVVLGGDRAAEGWVQLWDG